MLRPTRHSCFMATRVETHFGMTFDFFFNIATMFAASSAVATYLFRRVVECSIELNDFACDVPKILCILEFYRITARKYGLFLSYFKVLQISSF